MHRQLKAAGVWIVGLSVLISLHGHTWGESPDRLNDPAGADQSSVIISREYVINRFSGKTLTKPLEIALRKLIKTNTYQDWLAALKDLQHVLRLTSENSLQALQQADSDEARQTAIRDLREALITEFDADMDLRRMELERIRQRIADLEAAMERRATAKERIIDLRLQLRIEAARGPGGDIPVTVR